MKKIAFLDTVHEVLQEGLEKKGWICEDLTKKSQEEIVKVIGTFHGIVVRSRFPMNEDFLVHATQLEFIARSGAGLENIDLTYCKWRDIALFNAPEGNRNAVAEHALGMLLTLFNQLHKADREVREGTWDREGNRGLEVDGRVVGIIGYGNNGAAFAKKLRGFDVEVLAYDKFKSGYGSEYVKEVSLSEIQERANVLSLHIPQTPETIGMINNRFISQMDHPFYLINLSRGSIVKTPDLMDGIETKKILGACLDVLEYEKTSFENLFTDQGQLPMPFRYLINSSKVLLSPHVGGWTNESYYKLSAVLLKKIINFYK